MLEKGAHQGMLLQAAPDLFFSDPERMQPLALGHRRSVLQI